MKILVMDSDVLVGRSIQRLLTEDLVSTETDAMAGLARIACAEAELDPFDVLLCDYPMPGLTGLDAFLAVGHKFEHLLVILMSGYDDIVDAALAADAVLMKPLHSDEVQETIAEFRERRERATTRRMRRTQEATLPAEL